MSERFVLDPTKSGLAMIEQWIAQGYVAGLNDTLRARPVAASAGTVRFECALNDGHENFVGLVHGGVSAALIDIAGGAAAMTLLEPGETLLSADLQLRFLTPADIAATTMVASGRVTYRDARRIVAEVELSVDDNITALGTVGVSIRKSPLVI